MSVGSGMSDSEISKAQRQLITDYVLNRGGTSTLNIHLKGKWLREAGFETDVTLRIAEVYIVLIAECNKLQKMREQLYQVRQVVKGIKEAVV